MESPEKLCLPDVVNGDTLLHTAFKKKKFHVLVKMIRKGGHPLIKNLKGVSVSDLVDSMKDNDPMKDRLKAEIVNFSPAKDQAEGRIHAAARLNQMNLIKVYYFLGARFDSHDAFGRLPVLIAIEAGHRDLALYLMQHTDGAFDRADLVDQCHDFVAELIRDKSVFNLAMAQEHQSVLVAFFRHRKLPNEEIETLERLLKEPNNLDINRHLQGLLEQSDSFMKWKKRQASR